MNFKRPGLSLFLVVSLTCLLTVSQSIPVPTSAQSVESGFRSHGYLLQGAHVVAAPDAKPAVLDILVVDDVIQQVGSDLTPLPGCETVDLEGFYIYAGFIDAWCETLLPKDQKVEEPEQRKAEFNRHALASTRADNRHQLNAAFQAAESLDRKPDSLKKISENGFTIAHVVPSGQVISGQSALISLRPAPLREVLLNDSAGLAFRLHAPRGSKYPATLMGATAHLRQAFSDARRNALHHALLDKGVAVPRPADDDTWSLLQRVSDGELPAFWRADSRDDLLRSLAFRQEQDLGGPPILLGGDEAFKALDELQAAEAQIIFSLNYGDEPKIELEESPTEFKPELKDPAAVQKEKQNEWKQRLASLAELKKRDLPWSVGSAGLKNHGEIIPALRTAVEQGLSEQEALAALTTSPAQLLKLKRVGKIKDGYFAHLVVANGPLFDSRTKISRVFIDGQQQEVNTELKPLKSEDAEAGPALQLAGTWNFLLQSGEEKTPATIEFTQDGDKLNGLFRSEQGDGRVVDGRVKADKVTWNVVIGAGARELTLKFSGAVTENEMTGSLTPPFGKPSDWTAKRQPEDKSQGDDNPVQLAIETPDDESKQAANDDPRPTETQADRLAIQRDLGGNLLVTGATIMTGTGDVLKDSSILIRDGKIAAIGKDLSPDEGMTVIDAAGKVVIPGIIDTHSHIMIAGGTNEFTQSIVPEVSVEDVVRTDDLSEYRALAGGVTAARLLHGSANVIGGQDAVVKLKFGKSAHEHLVPDAPQGVKFALGENVKARSGRFPNTRLGVEATLKRAFLEAVDYRRQWIQFEAKKKAAEHPEDLLPPRRDYRLEALADIVNHQKFIHSHCYRADEILMLMRVASDLGIRVWSLQHVLEGYKIAPEILEHGASCSTFADWWAYKVEAYDAIPHNAALLHEYGINSVIKSDNAELIRHLYLEAAKSIRYGNMPETGALQAVTRNPARELGLDDRMGTLEVGKDGDLAIFNGHPFDAYSRCEMTVIEGDVYFDRSQASTAMSDKAAGRMQTAVEFPILPKDKRHEPLDLTPSDTGHYVLLNAHIHPVSGPEIERGTIEINDGRITAIGTDMNVNRSAETKVLDLEGLHVFPGLIDSGTTLGLTEIKRVDETSDFSEIGDLQPDLRTGVAINPDSELIPVSRAGGITTILAQPKSGLISGQASLVKLHGWTSEDMTIDLEFALRINWPGGDKKRTERLKEFLKEARLYRDAKAAAQKNEEAILEDPRYEAMLPYLAGEKPVLIEAHSRQEIVEAVKFAEEEKLKLILAGATDAWKVADELKKRDIPVIVGPVMERPRESWDPHDAPYANPGRLHEAGVKFCIRSDDASNSRNAPFEAAMAVAYGLPEDEGLKAVTLNAAEILGLGEELGSLDVGKRATLIVTDGSPLQHTAQIHGIFIDGKPYAPESRQTRFYEKYRERLKEIPAEVRTVERNEAQSKSETDQKPMKAPKPGDTTSAAGKE
jgi:imidazolonepropionase-like amidohydrolase